MATESPSEGREASEGRKGSCGGAVRLREHILDADGVAARRVVYENVRHRADELAVLEDGRAAHE